MWRFDIYVKTVLLQKKSGDYFTEHKNCLTHFFLLLLFNLPEPEESFLSNSQSKTNIKLFLRANHKIIDCWLLFVCCSWLLIWNHRWCSKNEKRETSKLQFGVKEKLFCLHSSTARLKLMLINRVSPTWKLISYLYLLFKKE